MSSCLRSTRLAHTSPQRSCSTCHQGILLAGQPQCHTPGCLSCQCMAIKTCVVSLGLVCWHAQQGQRSTAAADLKTEHVVASNTPCDTLLVSCMQKGGCYHSPISAWQESNHVGDQPACHSSCSYRQPPPHAETAGQKQTASTLLQVVRASGRCITCHG